MATREEVIEAIKTVNDPELYLDVWFLGLIYGIDIEGGSVKIEMTLTSAMCPEGPAMVAEVKEKVAALPGVDSVDVNVVFSPLWEPSDEVKASLGLI